MIVVWLVLDKDSDRNNMGVHPHWDNPERTIIVHRFEGRWTAEELRVSAVKAWDMMRQVPHQVNVILDLSRANWLPSGTMSQSNRILNNRPENAGKIALVGGNNLVWQVARVFAKTYGTMHPGFRLILFSNIDEARDYFRHGG